MTVTDYIYLINKPDAINEKKTDALGTVLNEFPYFQSARAMRLKGLYNQDSFKYNYALKVTAAHTTDRAVLFDFITSDNFTAIQENYYNKKASDLLNINVVDGEIVLPEVLAAETKKVNPIEQSILTSIKEASAIITENKTKEIEEKLEIGKPLNFSVNEKHSFQEWLQLSRTKRINRNKEMEVKEITTEEILPTVINEEKKKKSELIDKFIQTNPKIIPVKSAPVSNFQIDINKEDNSYLMTETLAKVYLEQKKYTKAIQAYEILILKYPEKISFFADRISDIKILQQNNN